MSERKVLNKYYPPDFDASKIPRCKREKNRQFVIRLMAPFNMRCTTCGEYIYRGKKFNARKEDVIGSDYLGIQIYRFYIKCTKCLGEITFLTDPENQDYKMENGAIRNFESVRLAEKQLEQEAQAKKDEEVNNPMKILENRTRDSRREMAIIETLEDLRELNAANANVDPKVLLDAENEYKLQLAKLQQEEDEEEVRKILGKNATPTTSTATNKKESILPMPALLKSDNTEEEKEIILDVKPYQGSLGKTSGKKSISSCSNEDSDPKRIKVEPTTSTSSNTSTLSSFLQAKISSSSSSESNAKVQLKKSNVGLFVKKKVESSPSTESSAKPAPSNNALGSLLTAYSDSESESE